VTSGFIAQLDEPLIVEVTGHDVPFFIEGPSFARLRAYPGSCTGTPRRRGSDDSNTALQGKQQQQQNPQQQHQHHHLTLSTADGAASGDAANSSFTISSVPVPEGVVVKEHPATALFLLAPLRVPGAALVLRPHGEFEGKDCAEHHMPLTITAELEGAGSRAFVRISNREAILRDGESIVFDRLGKKDIRALRDGVVGVGLLKPDDPAPREEKEAPREEAAEATNDTSPDAAAVAAAATAAAPAPKESTNEAHARPANTQGGDRGGKAVTASESEASLANTSPPIFVPLDPLALGLRVTASVPVLAQGGGATVGFVDVSAGIVGSGGERWIDAVVTRDGDPDAETDDFPPSLRAEIDAAARKAGAPVLTPVDSADGSTDPDTAERPVLAAVRILGFRPAQPPSSAEARKPRFAFVPGAVTIRIIGPAGTADE
jgi:hypothetical protein